MSKAQMLIGLSGAVIALVMWGTAASLLLGR